PAAPDRARRATTTADEVKALIKVMRSKERLLVKKDINDSLKLPDLYDFLARHDVTTEQALDLAAVFKDDMQRLDALKRLRANVTDRDNVRYIDTAINAL